MARNTVRGSSRRRARWVRSAVSWVRARARSYAADAASSCPSGQAGARAVPRRGGTDSRAHDPCRPRPGRSGRGLRAGLVAAGGDGRAEAVLGGEPLHGSSLAPLEVLWPRVLSSEVPQGRVGPPADSDVPAGTCESHDVEYESGLVEGRPSGDPDRRDAEHGVGMSTQPWASLRVPAGRRSPGPPVSGGCRSAVITLKITLRVL